MAHINSQLEKGGVKILLCKQWLGKGAVLRTRQGIRGV